MDDSLDDKDHAVNSDEVNIFLSVHCTLNLVTVKKPNDLPRSNFEIRPDVSA